MKNFLKFLTKCCLFLLIFNILFMGVENHLYYSLIIFCSVVLTIFFYKIFVMKPIKWILKKCEDTSFEENHEKINKATSPSSKNDSNDYYNNPMLHYFLASDHNHHDCNDHHEHCDHHDCNH